MKRFLIGLAIFLVLVVILALAFLPGFAESQINRVTPHEPYEVSEETRALHRHLVIADLHADTLLWARDPRSAPRAAMWTSPSRRGQCGAAGFHRRHQSALRPEL